MYVLGWTIAGPVAILCFIALSVDARSLLQGASFFWNGERRITNSTIPYSNVIYAHTEEAVPISAFGGCSSAFCPVSTMFIVQRLCFASQSSTVAIRTTLGTKSEYFDSELYVFRVEGDVPPIRGNDAPVAYSPSFSEFWAAPTVLFDILDDNSGSICSPTAAKNNDACKNKSPLSGPCSRSATGLIQECPPATVVRGLSRVEFPIYHEFGRPFQCYYAAVGAKDALANATELTFGLQVDITPPGPVASGGSPEDPRQGPFDLRDLGIGALPLGATVEPFVEPVWLNLTDSVASGCISASCQADPDFAEESAAPMFVYNNLCFSRATDDNQTAQIKTTYGGAGPSDTTLFVFDEDRTISEWNDAGNPLCSDGSLPDEANCGTDGCKSLDAQCPNGTVFWQLSRVDVPVGNGVGELCLNAAVGIRIGSGTVAQIGVDAAVLGEDGQPSQTLSITTDMQPNGTTITTTETTFANGTTTTDVVVVDPPPTSSEADVPQGTLDAIAGGGGESSGGGVGSAAPTEAASGSDGQRRTSNLGRGLGKWIQRMVNRGS